MPRINLHQTIRLLETDSGLPAEVKGPLVDSFRAWLNHGTPIEKSLALRAPAPSENLRQKKANRRRLLRLALDEIPPFALEGGKRRRLTLSERLDRLAAISKRYQTTTWTRAGLRDSPPPGSSGVDTRIWQALAAGFRVPTTRSGLWKAMR